MPCIVITLPWKGHPSPYLLFALLLMLEALHGFDLILVTPGGFRFPFLSQSLTSNVTYLMRPLIPEGKIGDRWTTTTIGRGIF